MGWKPVVSKSSIVYTIESTGSGWEDTAVPFFVQDSKHTDNNSAIQTEENVNLFISFNLSD